MRIGKIASRAEYRIDEQSKITNFWSHILVFQIEKILEICLFSKFENSKNFLTAKIKKILKFLKFFNFKK